MDADLAADLLTLFHLIDDSAAGSAVFIMAEQNVSRAYVWI
jgi:hypothetical protein